MKVLAISDTHNKILVPEDFPETELLIHCGDMTKFGDEEIPKAVEQIAGLRAKYKVCTFGNHDRNGMNYKKYFDDAGIILLVDQEVVIEGIRIYGVPWVKCFHESLFHFHMKNIEEQKAIWDKLPEGLDLLITHTPMHGFHDAWVKDPLVRFGCDIFTQKMFSMQEPPKIHCCGHIHEQSVPDPEEWKPGYFTYNVASLTENYGWKLKPYREFEI